MKLYLENIEMPTRGNQYVRPEQRLNAAQILTSKNSTSVRIHVGVLSSLRKIQAELIDKTDKTVTISDVISFLLNGKGLVVSKTAPPATKIKKKK